jgi:hypothetical protein
MSRPVWRPAITNARDDCGDQRDVAERTIALPQGQLGAAVLAIDEQADGSACGRPQVCLFAGR